MLLVILLHSTERDQTVPNKPGFLLSRMIAVVLRGTCDGDKPSGRPVQSQWAAELLYLHQSDLLEQRICLLFCRHRSECLGLSSSVFLTLCLILSALQFLSDACIQQVSYCIQWALPMAADRFVVKTRIPPNKSVQSVLRTDTCRSFPSL